MESVIQILLESMDQAFEKRSWHGANLRGSIRGLSVEVASWRPCEDRHNVWEIALHAAYWKYTVWRRLTSQRRGSFPLKGSNWFVRPILGESETTSVVRWKEEVRLLNQTHHELRQAVAVLRAEDLERPADGGRTVVKDLITGIIAHDLYHAGQIQFIKRMFNSEHTD